MFTLTQLCEIYFDKHEIFVDLYFNYNLYVNLYTAMCNLKSLFFRRYIDMIRKIKHLQKICSINIAPFNISGTQYRIFVIFGGGVNSILGRNLFWGIVRKV